MAGGRRWRGGVGGQRVQGAGERRHGLRLGLGPGQPHLSARAHVVAAIISPSVAAPSAYLHNAASPAPPESLLRAITHILVRGRRGQLPERAVGLRRGQRAEKQQGNNKITRRQQTSAGPAPRRRRGRGTGSRRGPSPSRPPTPVESSSMEAARRALRRRRARRARSSPP